MINFNTVWLPLQYECNNKCTWCYAPSKNNSSEDKRFNEEKEIEFLKLISDLNIKKTILIGGEPSLYPNIERVIKRIQEKGIKTSMVTNGRKLSDYFFVKRIKDAGLNSLTISIEGSNPDIHDFITNVPGSFYETIKGIDNSIREGFHVSTETTICRENENDLENIVKLLEQKNLFFKLFNICGPCVDELENSPYTLSFFEGTKIFEKIYLFSNKKNIKLVTPVPICNFNQELYQKMKKTKSISHACHILFGSNFVLDANGDVLPCVHFSNYPVFNIYNNGNVISSQEFRKLWEDPKEVNQKFRKILRNYPSKKCSEDNCWNPCTGGCSVFWLKYNPDEEIRGLNKNG